MLLVFFFSNDILCKYLQGKTIFVLKMCCDVAGHPGVRDGADVDRPLPARRGRRHRLVRPHPLTGRVMVLILLDVS